MSDVGPGGAAPLEKYAPASLLALRAAVRQRAVARLGLWFLPMVAAGLVLGFVHFRVAGAVLVVLAAALLGTWLTRAALRPYDMRWLLRRLNAAQPAFEDSLELLLDPTPALSVGAPNVGLAGLQRARLHDRLAATELPDLRPPYPRRRIVLAWSAAALVALLGGVLPAVWPVHWQTAWSRIARLAPGTSPDPAPAGGLTAELEVIPPAYTGLPAQHVTGFEAKVPEGSRIRFAVRLPPQAPDGGTLEFLDGGPLQLRRDGEVGRGERVITAATLYRLKVGTAAGRAAPLHRLDVIPDRPPEVTMQQPDRTLVLLGEAQKTVDLRFAASDDYGLGAAELSVALAQGSGENIKTTRQTIPLVGDGDARHRIYDKTLDLAALGFAAGDDLIVRMSVLDNRPGTPNRTQSASLILRSPAPAATVSEGMDGLAQKTLPAYFTSERQLIIDTEALQAARPGMAADRLAARSDALGVEQKSLRMRYGEFLGEESERSAQHDDDAASGREPPVFGASGTVTSEYGHVHDKPEAATLLDPDTRRLLKAALDQMWQAEGELRLVHPDAALPFEYKALAYIKEVQQAERIYLARAGVQLPQVDPARRLSGDRKGLEDRAGVAPAAQQAGAPIAAAWRALQAGGAPDTPGLAAWARAHRDTLANALELISAADRVQREPDCASCRDALAAALWPLMPEPSTAIEPRALPDAAGRAYLDALAEHP